MFVQLERERDACAWDACASAHAFLFSLVVAIGYTHAAFNYLKLIKHATPLSKIETSKWYSYKFIEIDI